MELSDEKPGDEPKGLKAIRQESLGEGKREVEEKKVPSA